MRSKGFVRQFNFRKKGKLNDNVKKWHITYHSSRHTTATLAITAGADISAVKEMLGHGSVTSTDIILLLSLQLGV